MIVETLAAQLAREGLNTLARQLRKSAPPALRQVADALGVDPSPTAIDVALASDPAAIDKLFALEIQAFEVETADRQNARALLGDSKWIGPLALVVVALFGGLTGALLFVEIPAGNRDAFMFALGTVGGAGFAGATGFFFGSSLGSKVKTDASILERRPLAPPKP